jgi:hypothetical protein
LAKDGTADHLIYGMSEQVEADAIDW